MRDILRTYLFFGSLDDEISERLEVLRGQVGLVLHDVDLEVDETCVGENNEAPLPAAKHAVRLLFKDAHFADLSEVVVHDLL